MEHVYLIGILLFIIVEILISTIFYVKDANSMKQSNQIKYYVVYPLRILNIGLILYCIYKITKTISIK